MDDRRIEEQRQKHLTDALERAGAFEQITQEKGWELLLGNYKGQLAQFINDMMSSKEKIETFEERRQQLMGIKSFLGAVDSDLATLESYRKEQLEKNGQTDSQK